ncbi:ribulose-phosphate 3-epimerase [Mediterraneibacter agrestimuris]|uniref:ribulose-phosphate 3-epimerase n=1 Tax=Mediterraneibacter agrestimuris TaxID=2941333 RepID=UPI0020405F46|nr:ribulose-phosphate 3-epimerase [Mediterraneibacter agrestimuris]
MKQILAPSILSADFKKLGEQMGLCEKSGAEYLHFDVMDGMFVQNISFGIPVLESIKGSTGMVLDVHLMIEEPIRYVESFAKAGADILTVHYEACKDVQAVIDKIHACGIKAGLTIKPGTPVDVLKPFLNQAEMFLIMSVEPGQGGQGFIPESFDKIRTLREMLNEKGITADIEVDGGIKSDNVGEVAKAGANVMVAGSAIFRGDIGANVSEFMRILKEYE